MVFASRRPVRSVRLDDDAQVVLATHSPVLAAVPGARVLELGADGWSETPWEDLRMVAKWRLFLDDPRRCWRRVLDD